MQDEVLQRRLFLRSVCGTLALLGLASDASQLAAGETPDGRQVPADLQAARQKLLVDMEANRGIGEPKPEARPHWGDRTPGRQIGRAFGRRPSIPDKNVGFWEIERLGESQIVAWVTALSVGRLV